jgi:broad specificity phosphatase PhoE
MAQNKSCYIWIRHGEKQYSNNKAPENYPQHDPDITSSSIDTLRKTGVELIEKYGEPDLIITSPYSRARQTVRELTHSLYEKNKEPDIDNHLFYDTNIAEYLGHQRGNIDLSKETLDILKNNVNILPQPGETMEQLKNRVLTHMEYLKITKDKITPIKSNIIWIVSHGLVISNIYSILSTYSNVKNCTRTTFYPSQGDYFLLQVNEEEEYEVQFSRQQSKSLSYNK